MRRATSQALGIVASLVLAGAATAGDIRNPYQAGLAAEDAGDFRQAERHYTEAIAVGLRTGDSYRNRAWSRFKLKRYAEAKADAEMVWKMDRKAGKALLVIGLCDERMGHRARALEKYREFNRLFPYDPRGYDYAAWILAVSPQKQLRNAPEALRLARKSYELCKGREWHAADTLAAAYAANGDFTNAVKLQHIAIELGATAPKRDRDAELQQRLQLYEDRKPFIESAASSN